MSELTLVAETDKYTVVGSYEPEKQNSLLYESEAALEKRFIALLREQGYEYLDFHTESELIANLRRRLEALNRITFTDGEWERFFKTKIADEREQDTGRLHPDSRARRRHDEEHTAHRQGEHPQQLASGH